MRAVLHRLIPLAMLPVTSLMGGAAQAQPSANGSASAFARMASLDHELAGVPDLSAAQRGSIARIEATFRPRFRRAGGALLQCLTRAEAAGEPPSTDSVRTFDAAIRSLWLQELREVRAVLRDGPQRARYDDNVTASLGGTPLDSSPPPAEGAPPR